MFSRRLPQQQHQQQQQQQQHLLLQLLLLLLLLLPAESAAFSLSNYRVFTPSRENVYCSVLKRDVRGVSPGVWRRRAAFALFSSALNSSNLLLNSHHEQQQQQALNQQPAAAAASAAAINKVKELVNKNKLFLFIKGSPEEPQCGFSRVVVQALQVNLLHL